MQAQLIITVTNHNGAEDSSIEVEGPIENWPWCFMVLKAAEARITAYHASKINKLAMANDTSGHPLIEKQPS